MMYESSEDAAAFQNTLINLLSWFLGRQSKRLEHRGEFGVQTIAAHICSSYRCFPANAFVTQRKKVNVKPQKMASFVNRDPEFLKPIGQLASFARRELAPFVKYFILHGSLATADYVRGWSDVDTLIVVNRDTFHDSALLLKFRELMMRAYGFLIEVDSLQHHGFIVVTENDLRAYPENFLPPVVLENAINLMSEDEAVVLDLFVRDDRNACASSIESRQRVYRDALETGTFRHHAYRGEYLRACFGNAENAMYQLKYFLAAIMSLPALYLTAIGKPCYKRESFDRCRSLFSDREWEIVEKASCVRRKWDECEDFPFTGNAIPEWVQAELGGTYFADADRFVDAVASLLRD